MPKPIKKHGTDYKTNIINNSKLKNGMQVWYSLSIKECENCWAIEFMGTCSDTLLCSYLKVDIENYRQIIIDKYDIFVEGDCTFFKSKEELELVMDWVEAMLLMNNM